jgi:hypothetical protein
LTRRNLLSFLHNVDRLLCEAKAYETPEVREEWQKITGRFSETSLQFCHTRRRDIVEDSAIDKRCGENPNILQVIFVSSFVRNTLSYLN